MKWLLMVIAFVLGAAITWFLTVRRVTRTVPVGDQTAAVAPELETARVVTPGEPVAGAVGVAGGADLVAAASAGVLATEGAGAAHDDDEDDPSRFGGAHTVATGEPGAAEGWDRDAEDEDALLSGPAESAVSGGKPETVGEVPEVSVPPVVDAAPMGDVAGVGDPAEVATLDDTVDETAGGKVEDATDAPGSVGTTDRPTQGEFSFDDEAPSSARPDRDS